MKINNIVKINIIVKNKNWLIIFVLILAYLVTDFNFGLTAHGLPVIHTSIVSYLISISLTAILWLILIYSIINTFELTIEKELI